MKDNKKMNDNHPTEQNRKGKTLISVKHLCKAFGDHVVLRDISTTINEGEVVAIIGPSGCGKSKIGRAHV